MISVFYAATAMVKQASTRLPSISTVQAPHWSWSQTFLGVG
jgi:hypothetical protein